MGNNGIRSAALKRTPPEETVTVMEWGGDVLVRGLTLGEQRRFFDSLPEEGSPNRSEKMTVQLIMRTVRDPGTGDLVFDPADAEAIRDADPGPFNAVFAVAARLSGMGAATEVEQDLETAHGDASD